MINLGWYVVITLTGTVGLLDLAKHVRVLLPSQANQMWGGGGNPGDPFGLGLKFNGDSDFDVLAFDVFCKLFLSESLLD